MDTGPSVLELRVDWLAIEMREIDAEIDRWSQGMKDSLKASVGHGTIRAQGDSTPCHEKPKPRDRA